MSFSRECFVLSGRGLCNRPIPRPDEPYHIVCVCVCVSVNECGKVQHYPSASTMMWSKSDQTRKKKETK